jgi:hypothetical protein
MGAAVLGIFGNPKEEAIYRRFCAWRKSSVACDHLGCRNHPPAPQQEHDTGRNSKDRQDERPPETRHSAHPEGGDPAAIPLMRKSQPTRILTQPVAGSTGMRQEVDIRYIVTSLKGSAG